VIDCYFYLLRIYLLIGIHICI